MPIVDVNQGFAFMLTGTKMDQEPNGEHGKTSDNQPQIPGVHCDAYTSRRAWHWGSIMPDVLQWPRFPERNSPTRHWILFLGRPRKLQCKQVSSLPAIRVHVLLICHNCGQTKPHTIGFCENGAAVILQGKIYSKSSSFPLGQGQAHLEGLQPALLPAARVGFLKCQHWMCLDAVA